MTTPATTFAEYEDRLVELRQLVADKRLENDKLQQRIANQSTMIAALTEINQELVADKKHLVEESVRKDFLLRVGQDPAYQQQAVALLSALLGAASAGIKAQHEHDKEST